MTGGRYIRGSGRKLKEFQKVPASNKARRTAGMLSTLFLFPPIIVFLQVPPCSLIPLPILSSSSSLQSRKYFETFLGFAIGLLCRQKLWTSLFVRFSTSGRLVTESAGRPLDRIVIFLCKLEKLLWRIVVLGARYSVYVSQGFKAQCNYEGKGMLLLLVQVVHIAQHGWLNY